jgi:hypothetical protein
MLIHRQNSFAPRSKQRTGSREAQSRDPVNKVKKRSLPLNSRSHLSLSREFLIQENHD